MTHTTNHHTLTEDSLVYMQSMFYSTYLCAMNDRSIWSQLFESEETGIMLDRIYYTEEETDDPFLVSLVALARRYLEDAKLIVNLNGWGEVEYWAWKVDSKEPHPPNIQISCSNDVSQEKCHTCIFYVKKSPELFGGNLHVFPEYESKMFWEDQTDPCWEVETTEGSVVVMDGDLYNIPTSLSGVGDVWCINVNLYEDETLTLGATSQSRQTFQSPSHGHQSQTMDHIEVDKEHPVDTAS